MPTKRGPARKSTPIRRKHRFRKKWTHHVTPVQMKELLDEAKALLEEWLINYDEVEVQVLADLEGKLVTLEEKLDEIEAKLDHAGHGLAALNADLDKLLTGLIQGTGTVLPANKSLYDILWVDRCLDEQGSFNWDTSAYTTVEQDISALFTTALTGTKRRKYQVYLDLSNVEGDASFDECYIRVYVKINGTYQCIDKATKTKANLQAEPGVPIEIPKTAEDAKITLQMKTALAVDKTIGYSWVEEKMEY